MMEALGISRKKVQLVLDKLVADGKIERVGSDWSGSWKINGERKGLEKSDEIPCFKKMGPKKSYMHLTNSGALCIYTAIKI